jgi:preprotein translocase subunit Sec63
MDPYKTLRVQPGASESDVRKAFRKLALQVWFYLMFLSLIRLMY